MMEISEITDWIKWFLIIFVSLIIAWEKAKRWYYSRRNKDRRNENPNLETKVTKLCQAFKDHTENDKQTHERIEEKIKDITEEQRRQGISIGTLKGRMNSR